MIELIIIVMILWIGGLSVAVFILDRCLKNQERLLYLLRNEIHSYKAHYGHIFCKSVDKDFDCSAVRRYEISKVENEND